MQTPHPNPLPASRARGSPRFAGEGIRCWRASGTGGPALISLSLAGEGRQLGLRAGLARDRARPRSAQLQILPDAGVRLVGVRDERPAGDQLAHLDVAAGRLDADVVAQLGRRAVALVALVGERAADILLVEPPRLLALREARLVVVGV